MKTREPKTTEQVETEFTRGINAIGLAHRQNVTDQLDRQAQHNETMRQRINGESIPGLDEEKGDDVGSKLAIDSPTTTNNYYGEPTKTKSKAGTIAKLALGAGLLATGAGGMWGASLIGDVVREKLEQTTEPTEQAKPTTTAAPDRDTKYSLDLGD